MSVSSPSPRLRGIVASGGALTLAGVLALSGVVGPGTEMTEAAWNDTEVAQASVKASWTTGFTRVTGGSFVYQDSSGSTSPNTPAEGLTRITGMGTNEVPTPTPAGVRSDNVWFTPQDKTESAPTSGESGSFPPRFNDDVRISRSETPYVYPLYRNYPIDASYCLSYRTDPTSGTNYCTDSSGTGARAEAKYTATNMNVRIVHNSTTSRAGRFIATGTSATVRCFDDGRPSTANASPGTLQLARSTGSANDSYTSVSDLTDVLPGGSSGAAVDSSATATDGYGHWFRKNALQGVIAYPDYAFVLVAQPRVNTFVQSNPPYALAEVSVTIQIYADSTFETVGKYVRSIDVVVARAECGLAQGGAGLPSRSGTYRGESLQRAWPSPIYPLPDNVGAVSTGPLEPQPAGFGSPLAVSGRGTAPEPMPQELLSTRTGPDPEFTTLETTTSAPPNPSGKDGSPTAGTSTPATTSTTRRTTTVTTTVPTVSAAPTSTTTAPTTQVTASTSAAPATVIPDEPAPLSSAARLEDVGTATVDGEDFVVVTPGDTVPSDAREGVAALEIWLNGDDPGDTWATFTSTDPDADGWRWAAINQETGTVVYIR